MEVCQRQRSRVIGVFLLDRHALALGGASIISVWITKAVLETGLA